MSSKQFLIAILVLFSVFLISACGGGGGGNGGGGGGDTGQPPPQEENLCDRLCAATDSCNACLSSPDCSANNCCAEKCGPDGNLGGVGYNASATTGSPEPGTPDHDSDNEGGGSSIGSGSLGAGDSPGADGGEGDD